MVKINKSMAALVDRIPTAPPIPQPIPQCVAITSIRTFVLESKEYKELEEENNELDADKRELEEENKELEGDKRELEKENKKLEKHRVRGVERQRLNKVQLSLAQQTLDLKTLQLVQSKEKLKKMKDQLTKNVVESQTMALQSANELQVQKQTLIDEETHWKKQRNIFIIFQKNLQKQLTELKKDLIATKFHDKIMATKLSKTKQVESDLRDTITAVNTHLEEIQAMLKGKKYVQ